MTLFNLRSTVFSESLRRHTRIFYRVTFPLCTLPTRKFTMSGISTTDGFSKCFSMNSKLFLSLAANVSNG